MGWTAVFYALLLGGFIAIAVGGIANVPECEMTPDGQVCTTLWNEAEYRFYETIYKVGFAAAVIGAFGLLGRVTGVLRR